jgi:uncharacterized protein YbjT (DUF2867 family)
LPTTNKIFVTGANGNQGSAAVRNLLSKGLHVKAFVHNSTVSKLNVHANLEIIKGDLDDVNSYRNHLNDCDGIFCLLTYIHGVNKEIKQGIDLVNAARENGIKHFVYSSVIGSDLNTGIPHWESKNKIEDHIKASGMSYTILRPSSLYENFLIPQVKSRILKGKLVLPTRKNTVQQFISSEDVGKIATKVFSDPGMYQSKTMNLAAEQMDGEQLAATFSKAMDREIKFQQLPMLITRLVMGRDLAKMFRWVNNNDACFVKDIQSFKNEFPGMLSLEEWIRIHFK